MIQRTATPPEAISIDDVAGDWFARRRSGRMTAAEAEAMRAWLGAAPDHQVAMDRIERAWTSIEDVRHAPEILTLRERGRARLGGLTRSVVMRAAAACLAVAVIGVAGWSLTGASVFDTHRFANERYATAVGEKTAVTLPDGSVVTLNTDTVLRTVATRDRRLVYLDQGQAFFRVAKNAERPFMVRAAGRTVVAVGTAFDVRVDGKRFEVTLVEGKVRVETPVSEPAAAEIAPAEPGVKPPAPTMRTTEMVAGDRFVASTDAQWVLANADTTKQTNWMIGRLKFEGEPMGAVAAEFSRYSPREVVVADPALARRRISGTFEAGDAEAFAQALEIAGLARIEPSSDGLIRLVSPERKNKSGG